MSTRYYKSKPNMGFKGKYSNTNQRNNRNRAIANARTTTSSAGAVRTFVPRSLGSPLALSERKYFDTDFSGTITNISTNWASTEDDPAGLNTLFAPTQGTDYNNRIGRKVQVLSIRIRGFINCDHDDSSSQANDASIIRIILFQDKQTNTTQASGEDVINSGATGNAISMFQNPANFGRFRVLRDKRITISNQNAYWNTQDNHIGGSGLKRPFIFSYKFKKPLYVHFNATNGGTVSDIVDNSFHIISGTNQNQLVPQLFYKCRITFIDV